MLGLVGALLFTGRVRAEARRPVVVAGDAGGPARTLPRRGVQPTTIGSAGRYVGEQVEQVPPAQAAPVDVEQVEHQPWHEAFDQAGSGPTVPFDLGDVEVVFDESCVRPLGRPQDRHPAERRAGAAGVEHRPDGEPDLVVGVGGGDHIDR